MSKTAEPMSGLRVLVVDDEADLRRGLARLARGVGAEVREAADGEEALAELARAGADVVLTDLMMPRVGGAELLAAIKQRWPATEVVVLTGYGTVQSAVQCLQGGAAHFLTKPFDNDEIVRLVERLGRQVLARKHPPLASVGGVALIAEDARMRAVVELVQRVAKSPAPVLIEGESGTGKELVARALHAGSEQQGKPFLAVNTAALPDTLLESELFGHERGAFTGAERAREGLFVEARGGTVFLDEVSSMSPSFQGKLLRVLQEKVVRPLGGAADKPVDFRLVSATNRDLEQRIAQGEFREDLFYRLGVVRIFVPPLRERAGDIAPLARHFLARAAAVTLPPGSPAPRLSDAALRALEAHPWPGNVRELENALQRALIVCVGDTLEPWHLGLRANGWQAARPSEPGTELDYAAGKQRALEEFQREFVHRALETSAGNVSRAAEICGMTRAALQRIMRQLGIERESYR